jgi:hypothetical protein
MKEHVGRLAAGAIARVQTWFDPPLGADARPLELRKAIIDDAALRVEPAGGGQRVFPFTHLSVTVLAESAERRAALEGALLGLEEAIEGRVIELRASVPGGFGVAVDYTKRPRAAWSPGQQFAVDYRRESLVAAPTVPQEQMPVFNAEVIRGTAVRSSYAFTDRQIRIGRTENPVDDHGRPRQNQIAFLEDADEHSRTVGRSHASIRYQPDRREYRLFDDGSHNGTRIIRDGRILEVTPRDPVGVTIASGDEIVVGTAAVRVRLIEAGH